MTRKRNIIPRGRDRRRASADRTTERDNNYPRFAQNIGATVVINYQKPIPNLLTIFLEIPAAVA